MKTAKSKGADDRVKKLLEMLLDRKYDAPTDVTNAIGKIE